MSPDARLARIAAKQHAAFSKQQARDAGFTEAAIRYRVDRGRWTKVFPRVYVVAAAPRTWEQRVIAVTLATGGVASSITAAALLGLLKSSDAPVHVALPNGQSRRRRRGIILHQVDLSNSDVRTVDGIRCTGPERTLVDLAGLVTEHVLEAAFDDAIQLGLTTIPKLDAYIRAKGLEHNKGVKRLRRLIADRAEGAMHRELEKMFRRKLRASGLPEPKRQFRIAGHAVDFVYPQQRVAIELDGLGGHFSAAAFRKDKRRDNQIVLAGYTLLHFTYEDVDGRWPDVEATLRQSLHGAG